MLLPCVLMVAPECVFVLQRRTLVTGLKKKIPRRRRY